MVGSARMETACQSVRAQAGFTASPTGRAVSKEGSSDPAVACGSAVAHRIKGTPGITGLSLPPPWPIDAGPLEGTPIYTLQIRV